MVCVQAYLMGVVWSCYKYLTQANESRARHRSLELDAARSPEDAEVQPLFRSYPIVLYVWLYPHTFIFHIHVFMIIFLSFKLILSIYFSFIFAVAK